MPLSDHRAIDTHVALAGRLAAWIERAGVTEGETIGDLAVGFADTLHAVASAAPLLDELLELDPTSEAGAESALAKLGHLHALLISEAKYHLEDLERRWPMLEEPLLVRAPDDEGEDEPRAGV